jgi:sodium-dependent dicarboxylate transporter 2/3/5
MFSDTSLIFIGGFIFSIAMVRWNLHSRIALKTVLIFGLKPKILLLGVTLVTFVLGLFVSNTATALTMCPNALAIITKIEELTCNPAGVEPFAKALLLSVAFTSSIGGMAVLTGTPPNLILAETVRKSFPKGPQIGFTEFLLVGFPTSLVHLVFLYVFFLIYFMRKVQIPDEVDDAAFRDNYTRLGKINPPEIVVVVLFGCLALLWIFRSDLSIGSVTIKGWSSLIYGKEKASFILDGTVAIMLSVLLFIIRVPQPSVVDEIRNERAGVDLEMRARDPKPRKIPSSVELPRDDELDDVEEESVFDELSSLGPTDPSNSKKWLPILEWEYAQEKMPWTILFLFSGGFVLNSGFQDSGLATWIGEKLKLVNELPLFTLILVIAAISTLMTNLVASNTACANILLPIVAGVSQSAQKIHPYLLMIPSAFATSSCFIMPVATPPNLICYSSGRLTTLDFVITGLVLTFASLLFVSLLSLGLVPPVFKAYSFPEWAIP